MTTPLEQIIAAKCPMDLAAFMGLALGQPDHGYYMHQDPLGARGDFTTAPEISQMFGEMLGGWLGDVWLRAGSPKPFTLLECGPGRGTLMADMMRVLARVPGFLEGAQLVLLETSPALKAKQKAALGKYNPTWISKLEETPEAGPLFVIGNEFLDALPIRQIQKTPQGWAERMVHHNEAQGFYFELNDQVDPALSTHLPYGAKTGQIFEVSPVRDEFVAHLSSLLSTRDGMALMIDYGHVQSGAGETFQAVKSHEYADPLKDVGEADLTAHVDFGSIIRIAKESGLELFSPVEQGRFLRNLGIEARAAQLSAQNPDIEKDLKRLVDADQMGRLFKVIAWGKIGENNVIPAGF